MRQIPTDSEFRPRRISKFLLLGTGGVVLGVAVLLVRAFVFPNANLWIRCGLSAAAAIAAGVSLILIGVGIARSWGVRGFQLSALLIASLSLLAAGGFLVFDLRTVPKAMTALLSESSTDDTESTDPATLEAEKPIVSTSSTRRNEDEAADVLAWCERTHIGAFNRHASGDPQYDDLVRKLIRGGVSHDRRKFGAPTLSQLEEWTNQALAQHPDDPFVRLLGYRRDPDPAHLTADCELAEKAFAATSGDPFLLFLARFQLWSLRNRAQNGEGVAAEPVLEAIRSAVAAGPNDELDALAWEIFLESDYHDEFLREHGDAVLEAVEPLIIKQPWLGHRLRGTTAFLRAYQARYAGLDSEFRSNLATARTELTQAWDLAPAHPGAAATMILVAMGQSDDPKKEIRQWFDRATTAIIDYKPAYDYFRTAMGPGWHGNNDALGAFAGSCLTVNRYDTWVPWEYVRTYRHMAAIATDPDDFFSDEDVWSDAEDIVQEYIASGTGNSTGYWETQAAILAARCDEMEACQRFLEKVDDRLNDSAARAWGVDADNWVGRTLAKLKVPSDVMESAEQLEADGKFAESADALEKAAQIPDLKATARNYLNRRIADLRAMQAAQERPWTPLFPGGDMSGWQATKGKPTVDNRGDIQASKDLILLCKDSAGPVFELRGELELSGPGNVVSGGFGFGHPANDRDDWVGVQVLRFHSGRMAVKYDVQRSNDEDVRASIVASPRVRIHVQVIGERLLAKVDGKVVLDRRIEERAVREETSQLALCASNGSKDASVRWCAMQWRKP